MSVDLHKQVIHMQISMPPGMKKSWDTVFTLRVLYTAGVTKKQRHMHIINNAIMGMQAIQQYAERKEKPLVDDQWIQSLNSGRLVDW